MAGQPLAAGLQRAQDEALLQGQGHADLDLPGRLGQAVHEGGEALLNFLAFQLGHERLLHYIPWHLGTRGWFGIVEEGLPSPGLEDAELVRAPGPGPEGCAGLGALKG